MGTVSNEIELKGGVKPAVVDLLYRLGDDCLIIGHRNSEWTGLGPILEEDIAFSSMAQDQMGHAQALYSLLHTLGEPEPDHLAFLRDAKDFRCCRFVALEPFGEAGSGASEDLRNNPDRDKLLTHGDWSLSLIRQFLFAEAWAIRLAALSESSFEPLAEMARKFRGEVKYHTMHGRIWIERLGRADADARQRVQAAIHLLWPAALGMFEPTTHDAGLAQAGVCPSEAEACRKWQTDVTGLLAEAGFTWPSDAKPVVGGRAGNHGPELLRLLASMQKVYRLAPGATW